MHGTNPRQSEESRQSKGLDWLYDDLYRSLRYVEDDALARRINDWLMQVEQLPETDPLNYIERRLSQLRQRDSADGDGDRAVGQYDMYRSGDDGEAEFPDACEGCPHHGVACPVFTSNVERDRRERMQRDLDNASPTRVKNAYRQFAEDNDCHRIPAFIEAYDGQHADLLKDGRTLYIKKQVETGRIDEASEAARIADDATADETGGVSP